MLATLGPPWNRHARQPINRQTGKSATFATEYWVIGMEGNGRCLVPANGWL